MSHGHCVGYKRSPTNDSWHAMLQRCYNPKNRRYDIYGAMGIIVCERWLKFENFLADMGVRPKGKTLDRWPDKTGNYKPSNCRWATATEQAQNRRQRRDVMLWEGKTVDEWAATWGVARDTAKHRIYRYRRSHASS